MPSINKYFLLFTSFLMVSTVTVRGQSEADPDYRIVSSAEALAYLNQHGLSFHDDNPALTLPSQTGLVYPMPNGEVVLLESGLLDDYPCFIFSSQSAFEHCRDAGFFPIPRSHQLWLETHADSVRQFLTAHDFYLIPLQKRLNLTVPFQSVADCEEAYVAVQDFVRRRRGSSSEQERQDMTHFFALGVTQFLVKNKGYKYELRLYYTQYNPCFVPLVITEAPKGKVYSNVISAAFRSMTSTRKLSFQDFYWDAANVLPDDSSK